MYNVEARVFILLSVFYNGSRFVQDVMSFPGVLVGCIRLIFVQLETCQNQWRFRFFNDHIVDLTYDVLVPF